MALRPRDSTTMASTIRYNCFWLASLGLTCSSLSFGRLADVMRMALVLAGAVSRCQGELRAEGAGCVAPSGVGPVIDGQDHGVIEGAAPRVAFAVAVALE